MDKGTLNSLVYHATFRECLPFIKKKGLIPRKFQRSNQFHNWECDENYVYFGSEPWYTLDYLFNEPEYTDEKTFESGIVLLAISKSKLNPDRLFIDKSAASDVENGQFSYKYTGGIRPNDIYVMMYDRSIEEFKVKGVLTDPKMRVPGLDSIA